MALKTLHRTGPLSVIAIILVLSACLRLFGVSGAAFALEKQDETAVSSNENQTSVASDTELDALLNSFQTREAAVKAEENRIQEREEKLRAVEASLTKKLSELEAAEARLRDLLAIAGSAAEDDVAQLTSVYENMKPKNAAIVFEEMDPAFAAGFLSRMRPDAAAAVMTGLTPKTAYAISVVLAGRHSETRAQSSATD